MPPCRHGGDVVVQHNHLRDIFANFCHRPSIINSSYQLSPCLFRIGAEGCQLPLMSQSPHPLPLLS